MKTVSTVTSQVVQQQRSQREVSDNPGKISLSKQAIEDVNDIFRALQAAFPAWRSAFPDNDSLRAAKVSWVKGLTDAGMTDKELIKHGVRHARLSESDFFPSVGKFISWCRPLPADVGMPELPAAWEEAVSHSHHILIHEWSHSGVYEAGRRTGWFQIRNGDAGRREFEPHYQAVVSAVATGQVFESPQPNPERPALECHRNGKKVTTEEAKAAGREAIDALRKTMGMDNQ